MDFLVWCNATKSRYCRNRIALKDKRFHNLAFIGSNRIPQSKYQKNGGYCEKLLLDPVGIFNKLILLFHTKFSTPRTHAIPAAGGGGPEETPPRWRSAGLSM